MSSTTAAAEPTEQDDVQNYIVIALIFLLDDNFEVTVRLLLSCSGMHPSLRKAKINKFIKSVPLTALVKMKSYVHVTLRLCVSRIA